MKKIFLLSVAMFFINVAEANNTASSGGSAAVSHSGYMAATTDNPLSYAYFHKEGRDHVIVCNKFECKKVKVDDK